MFELAMSKLAEGRDLSADMMQSLIEGMLRNEIADSAIAELLLGLRQKGESVSELVGAARGLRSHMIPIRTTRSGLLDTCGTGGDGAKTFNISTAAAIVAAAAGAPVAKHGNRKITSASGSADVLERLGIRIDVGREVVEDCIEQIGIGFCFAPALHPAMRHVSQVRRSLGVPTLFNYLGPLCNPAGAPFQLLGVGKPELHRKIAEALAQLPLHRGLVVRGDDGMDEVTLSSDTLVFEIHEGKLTEHRWSPASFGMAAIDPQDLYAEGPEESAAIIGRILDGELGGPRDIVVANAAAGLWICGKATSLPEGVRHCTEAIDRGVAKSLLSELAKRTHR